MDIMKEANNVVNKMNKEDLKENVMQQFKGHFLTIGLGLMLISDENGKKEIINSTADKFDGELKALGFNPPKSMVACLLMAAIVRLMFAESEEEAKNHIDNTCETFWKKLNEESEANNV